MPLSVPIGQVSSVAARVLCRWAAALAVTATACADDSTSSDDGACYPLDPMLPSEPPSFPYCEWAAGQLPEPPDGYERMNTVSVAFTPTEEIPCDPCNTAHFDALLKDRIAEQCDQPYVDFRGTCYAPPDGSETGSGRWCWVYGIYASNCVPTGQ
jgi:hypothetical protein